MKRAVALALALALLSCGALAQEERSFALNRDRDSDIYAWGGERLTPPDSYRAIYSITNGRTAPEDELFAAQSAELPPLKVGDYAFPRFAILDWKGTRLTDFMYDMVDYAPSGDALIYSIDGLYGAMSRSLEALVPCEYDAVVPNGEGGFLMVAHGDDSAPPVMFMAQGGKPEATGAKARFYWGGMSEGLMSATDQEGYYGFLNPQGQWAIQPTFEWVQNFLGGYAIARQKGKVGIINKRGKWTVKPTYDDDRGFLPDGSAAVLFRGTRAYVVRPSDGKPLFSLRLTDEGYLSVGPTKPFITVTEKGKVTLYDVRGQALVSLDASYAFDLWSDHAEDRLLASTFNEGILMDLRGEALFRAQGLNFLDTVDGRALYLTSRFKSREVYYDGDDHPYEEAIYETYRFGIVDSDGNALLPTIYRQLYMLVPGRYYAEDAQRWGVIDQNGEWILSGSVYDQLMD